MFFRSKYIRYYESLLNILAAVLRLNLPIHLLAQMLNVLLKCATTSSIAK